MNLEFPFLSAEAMARIEAQSHCEIRCTDECGDSWITTIGDFVRDNADCIADEDIMPVLINGRSEMASQCGPFEVVRVEPVAVTEP